MAADEISKDDQFKTLLNHVLGNQAAWFIAIGLRTGLFRVIADNDSVTDDDLSAQLGFHPRYVDVWCRGAYAFELLDWDEVSGYRLAPHLESLLFDAADPQFMGGRIQFFTALYEDYRAFPDHLQTGEIWPRSEHDPFLLEALKNATKPDGAMITEHLLPQAPDTLGRLEAGGHIIDIGAGGGEHAIHYVRRFPDAGVVGLEADEASITLARRAVSEADLDGRVQIRHGDANHLDERDAFDLATMNIALHETGSWEDYENVLERMRRALKLGGTVVVSELPYPDSPRDYRAHPVYKMYAGVQLHEALVGCGMITQGQLRDLLDNAGFDNVRVAAQPMPTRYVMLGDKA